MRNPPEHYQVHFSKLVTETEAVTVAPATINKVKTSTKKANTIIPKT